MDAPARATRPEPGIWQNPGPGRLDPEIWRNTQQAADLLMSSEKTAKKYLVGRIPHIITLAGMPLFHIDLLMAIRGELVRGHNFDEALVNLGIESPPEDA